MTNLPDDRRVRREMEVAHRHGWHPIDLTTAIPHPGDSLRVTLVGQEVLVVREEDDDIRAYRTIRKPHGTPQAVRCVIRYGMIFVNLDLSDHLLADPAASPTAASLSA
ncbi:(2Fe-2S)-binding protein [Streptomyces sp. NPDC060194]|uniref:(2Fe-2S)-binding protein n=1 Tax=Streptomyces sp. NPDC060194 TaxID=3347069 RepID=UPI0036594C9E